MEYLSTTDTPVAMRGLLAEVGGQVDDVDGLEGALLDTDTASNAQRLGELGDLTYMSTMEAMEWSGGTELPQPC